MRFGLLWICLAGCNLTPEDESPPPMTADTARASNTGPPTDTGEPTDTGTPKLSCSAPDPLGPWAEHPIAAAGSTVQRRRLSNSSSLFSVREAAFAATQAKPVSIAVSGAIVTAVADLSDDASRATLWAEDMDGPVVADNVEVDNSGLIAPGDRVNFTVTEVANISGGPHVTALLNFDIDGVENEIPVLDGNATALSYEAHGERIVEIWGEVTAEQGPCGSFTCFEVTYGDDKLITYPTTPKTVAVGDCVHYLGPLDQQDTLQFDASNAAWVRIYPAEMQP
ncbi:MAG: hypothetical protein AAGA48_00640 [Myxococcota bacterium]